MNKTLRGLLAAGTILCAVPLSAPAYADNYVAKDGNANPITFAAKLVGSLLHPFHIAEGQVGGTGAPQAVNVDASGNLSVTPACSASSSAPTYTAGLNPLSCDLSGNLRTSGGGGGGGGAVTAASGAFASGSIAAGAEVDIGTGGSPGANTVNGRLATIVTNTTSLATAANQTTANTSLSTIATNTAANATAANQTSLIGTKAPGTAATNSLLAGGVYTAAGITLTTGQQAALQFDSTGHLLTTASVGGLSQGSTTSGQTGILNMGAVTTSAPTYTTAQTSPLSLSTAGDLRVTDAQLLAAATGAIPAGSNTIGNVGLVAGSAIVGKVGIDQTTPGTTNAVQANIASGGVVSGAFADGALTTVGTKADAANCATTNTLIACTRQLHTDLTGSIPAQGSHGVNIGGVEGLAAANATAAGNPVQVGGVYNTAVTAATTGQAMALGVDSYGEVAEAPYGPMMTALTAASGNVANASAAATLAAAASKTTYITGFQCTAAGATAASVVNLTVAGVITGTMTYTFVFPAGATTLATPIAVTFAKPVPASAVNTAIVVTLPAGGAGNTNAACNAQGFRL